MGEQDAMGVMACSGAVRGIDPGRLLRLWPEVDVYGRIRRLLAADRATNPSSGASRSHDPAA